MGRKLEDVEVLQVAEKISNTIWDAAARWPRFEREVMGSQLIRAADSIGANIAEQHGRYHYGEKLQFLFYARGSAYETRFWVGRAERRGLVAHEEATAILADLDELTRQLNGYINYLRRQRTTDK